MNKHKIDILIKIVNEKNIDITQKKTRIKIKYLY